MKKGFDTVLVFLFLAISAVFLAQAASAQQSSQPPASEVAPDQWPKSSTVNGAEYTIYQPQLDDWDGYRLNAHNAVSVQAKGAREAIFGVVNFSAKTHVDRVSRTVHFSALTVDNAIFPSAPDSALQYQKVFQDIGQKGNATMPLDRLQAQVAIISAQKQSSAVPVKNSPPAFIFSQQPAILVLIDGTPVWTAVQGTSLKRVLNTRAFIASDQTGTFFMHIFDGFIQAQSLNGPWQAAANLPRGLNDAANDLAKKNLVDLMTGDANADTKQMPTLKNGAPALFVATVPTELIVTGGAPNWAPLKGTMLLYASNTTGNIFKNMNDQQTYVLVTGRWFSAPDLAGPWVYVPGASLPPDFAKIPDDSAKENVKASIPGTPQAQDAVIANGIPQTAAVSRTRLKFIPVIDGTPQLKSIDGTMLSYVANSSVPLIKVDFKTWYACQGGVWFTSNALNGQWTAATSVPAAIYSIPPSSPLYYVTGVKIYDSTEDTVIEGYTPGYMGTAVSPDNVIVYGTGYNYQPYMDDDTWYSPPVTYGYAANPTWTPWTGWALGFGLGWALDAADTNWGWGWGAAPYWGGNAGWGSNYGYARSLDGAAAWGPNNWAATSNNAYHQWGNTGAVTRTSAGYNAWTGNAWSSQVGHSYNSVTGQISAGQRGTVSNVYTGNYARGGRGGAYNPATGASAAGERATIGNASTGRQETVGKGEITGPGGQTTHVQQAGNNVYAERNGNVYKDNNGDFQQLKGDGSWNNVTDRTQVQSLQDHQWARQAGDLRSASSSWGGKWGGGFDNDRGGGGFGDRGWGGGGFRSGGSFRGGFGGFHGRR